MKTSMMFYMIYGLITISEMGEKPHELSLPYFVPAVIAIVVVVVVGIVLTRMNKGDLGSFASKIQIRKWFTFNISARSKNSHAPQEKHTQEIEVSTVGNTPFCNLCKIGELHKLPLMIRPVISSLRLTEIKIIESLSGVSASIATNQEEVWDLDESTLGPFSNEKTILHMISLINPKTWGTHEVWKIHHEKIRKIAMYEGAMARRLHVMWVDDLEDEVSIRMIFSLMLAEYLCNIRARLLCVKRDSVKALEMGSDALGELYRWHDFCLFDYATLTTKYKMYGVIFTDITPYFIKENCLNFKLFSLNTSRCELYYALRKNFYVGWNYSRPGVMFTLFELFNLIRTRGFDNIVNLSELRRFVPKGAKEKIPNRTESIENLLNNCIIHSEEHRYNYYKTEDYFQQELNELLERN